MTTPLPIGTLWVGNELRWFDRLSLHSFVQRGHEVTLFHTHDLKDPQVPGITLRPARDAFEYPDGLPDQISPAVFSDIFRINMISNLGLTWIDTDVLCLKPLVAEKGYLVGYEDSGMINGAVLCLPPESEALGILCEQLNDPSFVPGWLSESQRRKLANVSKDQRLYEAARLVPNVLGPRALTHVLIQTGERSHALPAEVLNPVPWGLVDICFNPFGGTDGWITDKTLALHLYSSRIRPLHKRLQPYPSSIVGQIASETGFDFLDLRKRK